jgi:hypothetical protein
VKFKLYNNAGEGPDSTGLYLDGAVPFNVGSHDLTGTGINLHDGDLFQVQLTYDGTTLTETITDTNTRASTTISYALNLVSTLGTSQAYVGFTAGTGGLTSVQNIQNWTYTEETPGQPASPSVAVSDPVTVPDTTSVPQGAATPGLYDPASATFFLRNTNQAGPADSSFVYGPAGQNWIPLAGDWTGSGTTTVGLYDPSTSVFFLRDSNSAGAADITFQFGPAGLKTPWIPLTGDWTDTGTTSVGLYDPATGTFYLKDSNSAGPADMTFIYGPGNQGWLPIAGDWDGNGTTTVGLYNPTTGTFYLKNTNSSGPADLTFNYGPGGQGWRPLAGVWNGSTTTVGVYDPATGTFYLKDTNSAGPADLTFNYGPGGQGWTPLVGSWVASQGESLQAARSTGVAPALVNADATGLTAGVLSPIVQQAIARWAAAGAPSTTLAQMANTQLVVGDLPNGELAHESPGQIVIDRTAAGYGWFVDPTPGNDQEFAADTSDTQLHAVDPQAVDRIDLLTVVEHELGIVAGLKDLDSSTTDLMSGQLAAGIRRVPTAADVDAIFAIGGVS